MVNPSFPDPSDADGLRELPAFGWLLRHAPRRLRGAGLAAATGLGLLVLTGLLVLGSAPFVGAPPRDVTAMLVWGGTLVALASAGVLLPWQRLPRRTTAALPAAGLCALALLGVLTPGVSALPYVAVIPLFFLHVGMFHRAAVGVALLPLAGGTYVALVASFTPSTGVRLALYAAVWIVTSTTIAGLVARHRAVRTALVLATRTDPLTALGNRLGLDARLRSAEPGDCVVLCDLDHFKAINDAFGHAAGDEVLSAFGGLLVERLRGHDYAARFGGEEFALHLPGTTPAQAVAALGALRDAWLDLEVGVTFSAGVAAVTAGHDAYRSLAAADVALYDAKAGGRDQVRVAPEPCPAADTAPSRPVRGARSVPQPVGV